MRTWGELGVANGGLRATSRALKFAMGKGLATAELGRPPKSLDEYAEVMEESRATANRDQQGFPKGVSERGKSNLDESVVGSPGTL